MKGKNKLKWPVKKVTYIHVEVYDLHLWFFKDRKTMTKALEYIDCPTDNLETSLGRAWWGDNPKEKRAIFLVGVFDNSLDTLVHEIAHISSYMLQQVNIPLESASSEPLAYLQGYLFNKLKSKINIKKREK